MTVHYIDRPGNSSSKVKVLPRKYTLPGCLGYLENFLTDHTGKVVWNQTFCTRLVLRLTLNTKYTNRYHHYSNRRLRIQIWLQLD